MGRIAYGAAGAPERSAEGKVRRMGGSLPDVDCPVCGCKWGTARVWYPSLSVQDRGTLADYSDRRTVSPGELERLRRGLGPRRSDARLPPGSGIGPIEARLSPYATDFVSVPCLMLAAKPAIRRFQEAGVILPHGPALVYLGRTKSEAYVALELDPKSMCSMKTEEALGVARCDGCGGCRRIRGYDHDLSRRLEYGFEARRAPERHGLILEDVEEFVLATEDFMNVYRSHKMTGLRFERLGIWV